MFLCVSFLRVCVHKKVTRHLARNPETADMTRESITGLVQLFGDLFPSSTELQEYFGCERVRPALGVRTAVMLLRKLRICSLVCGAFQNRHHIPREAAVMMLRMCVTYDDMYDPSYELTFAGIIDLAQQIAHRNVN